MTEFFVDRHILFTIAIEKRNSNERKKKTKVKIYAKKEHDVNLDANY